MDGFTATRNRRIGVLTWYPHRGFGMCFEGRATGCWPKPGWLRRPCTLAGDEVDSGQVAAPRETTCACRTAPQRRTAAFVLSTR